MMSLADQSQAHSKEILTGQVKHGKGVCGRNDTLTFTQECVVARVNILLDEVSEVELCMTWKFDYIVV